MTELERLLAEHLQRIESSVTESVRLLDQRLSVLEDGFRPSGSTGSDGESASNSCSRSDESKRLWIAWINEVDNAEVKRERFGIPCATCLSGQFFGAGRLQSARSGSVGRQMDFVYCEKMRATHPLIGEEMPRSCGMRDLDPLANKARA